MNAQKESRCRLFVLEAVGASILMDHICAHVIQDIFTSKLKLGTSIGVRVSLLAMLNTITLLQYPSLAAKCRRTQGLLP